MTNNSFVNISSQQLRRAADLQERIESLQAKLAALSGSPAPAAKALKKKGGISAAGRANISAAQKKRWAEQKSVKPAPAPAPAAPKAKRKISAAARARMIAGAKARWAKIRAAKQAA